MAFAAPIILHVGSMKAASTSLGLGLFSQHPELENVSAPLKPLLRYVVRTEFASYDLGQAMRLLRAATIPPPANGGKFVVSHEWLGWSGTGDRSLIAYRLRELFGEARIVFVLRNQYSFLSSLYMHNFIGGKAHTPFETWLEDAWASRWNSIFTHLKYHELIAVYARLFGRENTGVFLFEQLNEAPDDFAATLCAFLEIDADAGKALVTGNKRKQGATRWGYATVKWPVLAKIDKGLRPLVPSPIHRALRNASTLGRSAQSELSDRWKERVASVCAEGNRELAATYGLPLQRYGYPL